jgi:hypothetical protein
MQEVYGIWTHILKVSSLCKWINLNNALVFKNCMASLVLVLNNVLVISHGCLFQIQIDEDIFAHHEVVHLKANLKTYLNL